MKKVIRRALLLLASALLLGVSACAPNDPADTDKKPDGEPSQDETLAENYDFGDASGWAGDALKVTDLGDCLLDAYPFDDKYDWGQSILWDEEAQLYKMWWCRNSGYDTIWYAESKDLKHWTNAQKLMTVQEDSTWIKMHVGKPSVLKVNGRYIMYFEAPATLLSYEFDNNVFMATSDDGIHWQMYEGDAGEPYPVIRMTDEQMAESMAQYEAQGVGFYGIGQPSALYHDGKYYVYCTYSLIQGDRMYLYTSDDGIHFSEGVQVFDRANCGVKYNTVTEKFMMAYEYTQKGVSRVYYMQSDDGVEFTYAGLVDAGGNPDILSTGGSFVRGYPDFVGDGEGNVSSYTFYVAYMEGTMADAGQDWRQYCNTWDIHIAAVNLKEFANRTQVLPDGHVLTQKTLEPYREGHKEYEELLCGIHKLDKDPSVDKISEALGGISEEFAVARAVSDYRAVPNSTTASFRAGYTQEALYVSVEVRDASSQDSDCISLLLDEKRYAQQASEVLKINVFRNGAVETVDGEGNAVENVQIKFENAQNGYTAQIKIPWRFRTSFAQYEGFGFDCYVFDNSASTDFKSLIAWNDCHASYDYRKAGELYFMDKE